jgi:hypothetical protein
MPGVREKKGGKRNILKVYSFYDWWWCWEEKKVAD